MSFLKPDRPGAAGVNTAFTFQTGRSPKNGLIHVASVASKINNSFLSLSTASTKVLEVKTKQGDPREREESHLKGWDQPTQIGNSNPARGEETTLLQHLFPNKPPHPPKNAVWKVQGEDQLPETRRAFCFCLLGAFPLAALGSGLQTGKLV